jgi:alpha-beta hydrolase superfamily lysophospholipase
MAVREEYTFKSKDDIGSTIHAVKWTPDDNNIKAILQICHGMQEYILRYEEFATFMADHGFAVIGHDHIGHGTTVSDESELGIMHTSSPAEVMMEDILSNFKLMREQYPDLPFFILGHSMGSYLLRMLLSKKASELKGLSGAVIMGTGTEKNGTIRMGRMVVNLLASFRGWNYKSKFVAGLMFGAPYKFYDVTGKEPERSWLSKNVDNVKAYYKNPLNNYMFSLNGYKVLLTATLFDNQMVNINKINKDLPIIFVSGDKDPVGNLGIGVKEAYKKFEDAGIRDVSIKLYHGDRHEVLNELDRETVYADLLNWMQSRMK